MSCLNTEGFGDVIAIIEDVNASKKKRNSKNNIINNPTECQFCFKRQPQKATKRDIFKLVQ